MNATRAITYTVYLSDYDHVKRSKNVDKLYRAFSNAFSNVSKIYSLDLTGDPTLIVMVDVRSDDSHIIESFSFRVSLDYANVSNDMVRMIQDAFSTFVLNDVREDTESMGIRCEIDVNDGIATA